MEIRRLTKQELNNLICSAPESETENLLEICKGLGLVPYEFFNSCGFEHFGIINERPLYVAVLIQTDGKKTMFTIVNKNIKQQFSLFKYCKRGLKDWLTRHPEIYATMENNNERNLNWTKRLGFRVIKKDIDTTTLKLTRS